MGFAFRDDVLKGLSMKSAFTVLAVLAVATYAMPPAFARAEHILRVIDGDTFEIAGHRSFGEPTIVRVIGLDTPEHDAKAKCPAERAHGDAAKKHAEDLASLSAGRVWLTGKPHKDKYGRWLFNAALRIDGRRLDWSEAMIHTGYGRIYVRDAKGKLIKPDWCAILRAKPANLLPANWNPQ
jgi:endonuclease YncB( thermonuclease family)